MSNRRIPPLNSIKPSAAMSREVQKLTPVSSGRFHQFRGVLLLVLTTLVLWLNSSFIKPLIMGAIFAVVLYPLMGRLQPRIHKRSIRAGVLTILFALGFLVPLGALLIAGADAALDKLPALQQLDIWGSIFSPGALVDRLGLRSWIDYLADVSPISENQFREYSTRVLAAGGSILGKALQSLLTDLPGVLFANLIILLTIFFLLIDGPRAVRFLRENSVFGPRQTDVIFYATTALCNSVIVATVVSGAVQASLIGLSCLVTGTDGVVLIVLVSFIASFFPVFGTAPVTVFLTLQAFFRGEVVDGFVFLAFIFLVGVSDNIVRPYVLKGGASLHPLVGFVAAFGALEAIGFYGLFIGPVVAGLFFTVLPVVTKSYSTS